MKIKRFIGGMLESNGYIITCSGVPAGSTIICRECYIIDPGYAPRKFLSYVNDEKLKVKGIILTHHHYDHTGGVQRIKKELDCPVMMHRSDVDMYGKDVDVYLEDGDVLNFSTRTEENGIFSDKLVVYNTPGHTRGGICLLSVKSKVCFTGDTVFNVDLGRTDLEDGSDEEMENSIRNIVDKWSGEIMIYPGHGDPATMKSVRRINAEYIDIVNK